MSDGSILCSAIGFMFCALSCVLLLLGFSTPNWLEPNKGNIYIAKFEKIGLWEMCFKGYTDPRGRSGKVYNGCWWIFAREYDSIRGFILPRWLIVTQVLMTINVVLVLTSVLLGLLLLLKCFPSKVQKIVTALVTVFNYAIGFMGITAADFYGTNADNDRTWLDSPQLRHLSWSFTVCLFGSIAALFSGICYTVYYIKTYYSTIRTATHQLTAYRAHELRNYDEEPAARSRDGGLIDSLID